MPGTRLTALILAALSITALRAQDKTATASQSPGEPLHQSVLRPEIGEPQIPDPPVTLPPLIHLCIAGCFPIMLDRGHYITFGPANTSIYTVESFTRESIILHRTDKGHFPLTATMTGQMSGDGNSIVNGKIVWTSGNSGSGTFRAVWGSALDTLPGGDKDEKEREFLNIPCNASSHISIAKADEQAEQLIELRDLPTATCWLRIAASQGDAEAQGALAAILYEGIGVPVNVREAAIWAEKSSAQGFYLGEGTLSKMYAKGNGKPKDPTKAQYWRARYEKDKLALEQAQQRAQEAQRQSAQAQAQQNQAAGMLLLQLFLGAFSGDSESPRKSSMVCTAEYARVCAQ